MTIGEMKIEEVKKFFFDPISGQNMQNAYGIGCGHVFEQAHIVGWMEERKVKLGGVADCPLCQAPIDNLVRHHMVGSALNAIYDPDNAKTLLVKDLTKVEVRKIEAAINFLTERRKADSEKIPPIPDRLAQPKTFLTRLGDFSKEHCS